jgi:hypothetical protein
MKTKNGQLNFKTALFGHINILKRSIIFTFWCMVVPLVHIRITPSEGPKDFDD